MKINFFVASDPEEYSPHALMAALHLERAGNDVKCVCLGPSARGKIETPLGAVRAKSIRPSRNWWESIALQANFFWEIVVCRMAAGTKCFYLAGNVVAPAGWLALLGVDRKQIIYHTQDFLEPGQHFIWAFFEKRIARRAGHVICNEINRARILRSIYQLRDTPAVVRTALPTAWPMPQSDPALRCKIIACTGYAGQNPARLIMSSGGFSGVRCVTQLLEAFQLLPDNYLLILTGLTPATGEGRSALDVIQRLNLQQRAACLGRLSFADLLRHCACCDIGMLLYPNDGIGNFYQAPGRLTEYLGVGLPVVASNFPGLEALVRKHELGATCDPRSPREIAHAIRELGDLSDEIRFKQSLRLRALARTNLAYESHASRIDAVIKNISAEFVAANAISESTLCRKPV